MQNETKLCDLMIGAQNGLNEHYNNELERVSGLDGASGALVGFNKRFEDKTSLLLSATIALQLRRIADALEKSNAK